MWWSEVVRSIARPALLLAIIAVVLASAGCGYRHPSAALGDGGGAVRLYAPLWKNQTSQMGLEAEFHHDLIGWLQRNGGLAVSSSRADADFDLSGEIIELSNPGLTYGAFSQAKELRATMAVSYRLTSRKDGAVVWEAPMVVMEEPYPVGDNAIRTRDNRQRALVRISDKIAEEIYLKVLGYRAHDRKP